MTVLTNAPQTDTDVRLAKLLLGSLGLITPIEGGGGDEPGTVLDRHAARLSMPTAPAEALYITETQFDALVASDTESDPQLNGLVDAVARLVVLHRPVKVKIIDRDCRKAKSAVRSLVVALRRIGVPAPIQVVATRLCDTGTLANCDEHVTVRP
jgi:hypothetical protein